MQRHKAIDISVWFIQYNVNIRVKYQANISLYYLKLLLLFIFS